MSLARKLRSRFHGGSGFRFIFAIASRYALRNVIKRWLVGNPLVCQETT